VKRLSDLQAVEVSLVPKGANKKRFIIFKSDKGEGIMEKILKTRSPKLSPIWA